MLAEGQYKYVRNLVSDETEELYNMLQDPHELKNLALNPEFDEVLAQMREATIQELKRTDAAMADNLPPHGTEKRREEARESRN